MKKSRKFICTAFLVFILFYCKSQTGAGLNVDDFEKGIGNKDSVQVLDVRTPREYNGGHLKDALLADWNDQEEFDRRISFIDKQRPVYVYCLSGGRSAAAAAKMRTLGYLNVFELKGGISAWKAEHKAVENKSDEKQMSISELNTAINASKMVLVDFGAAWCPPCKTMEPVLKSLQQNNPNKFTLVKVDGGRDEEILEKFKVTNLPVFILFKDGKQVWRRDGIVQENEIANLLN